MASLSHQEKTIGREVMDSGQQFWRWWVEVKYALSLVA